MYLLESAMDRDSTMPLGTENDPIVILDSSPGYHGNTKQLRSPVKILDGDQYRNFVQSLTESESNSEEEEEMSLSAVTPERDDSLIEIDSAGEASPSTQHGPPQLSEPSALNYMGVPIFEQPPPKYTATRILQILLDPNIDQSIIAKERPIEVKRSSTFVVDLTCLKHPDDVKKDMYGRWDYSGSHPEVFRCSFDEFDKVYIEKCAVGATGQDVYYLRRIRSSHPSNPNFRRLIAFVHNHNNQPHRYCLAVYYLPSGFHPQAVPHGNSKTSKSFFPTLPSTMQQIKERNKGLGPKQVVCEVSSRVGGIISATDSCAIPRNELQVTKLKSRMKSSSLPVSCGTNDELGVIMQQAFMEDKYNQFIRDVRCLREPAVVVSTERQLNDLVRFCTPANNFSIVTIDPTFSLGDFDVTVITYRHTLLISRQAGQPPAIIGPILIHYKKTFATYLFFASSLISLRRELVNIRCFGTDGETALIDAFQHECPNSVHLLCSIHMRRNTKAKLQDLGIPERFRTLIIDDIFGKQQGSHYNEGLIDATSDLMYYKIFASLTRKWQELEVSASSLKRFVDWFRMYKSHDIKRSMLKPVREKAGLGRPPVQFTTNASESINAVLKRKVNYKRNELPVFLEKIKELIREQDSEIEKAVIDRGKYMINPGFKKFSKTEEEWFTKMKEGDRVRHLQRFSTFKIPDVSTSLLNPSSITSDARSDRQEDYGQNSVLCSTSSQGASHGPRNVSSHLSGQSSDIGSGCDFRHALSSGHTSTISSQHKSGHNVKHSFCSESGYDSPHHTLHDSALSSGHDSSGHVSAITSGHSSALTSRDSYSLALTPRHGYHRDGHGSALTTERSSALSSGHGSPHHYGHDSALTSGCGSALTAEHNSPHCTGYGSALTSGHSSPYRTVHGSALTTGSGSALTSGPGSALISGYGSPHHTGHVSSLTSGHSSALGTSIPSSGHLEHASALSSVHSTGHVYVYSAERTSSHVHDQSLYREPSSSHSQFPHSDSGVSSEPCCSYTNECPYLQSLPDDGSSDEDLSETPRKCVKRQLFPPANLSVDFVDFCDSVSVAAAVLESVWNKASQLMNTSNAIAVAPGLDLKSHTVISTSGNRPHLVQMKKTGQYTCDKACGNWNSLSICSHTVAVAEINGELSKFVAWFIKAKKKPSVSKLVLTGMPKGRGRKGGKQPQSKKKRLAVQTRTSIDDIAGVRASRAAGAVGAMNKQRLSTSEVSNLRMPSHPPPLVHFTPRSPSPTPEPFILCFVTGKISVCYGCRQKYPKPCQPPHDLCVRHKEWREFFAPGSSTAQARFGNVYYHCNTPCIQARCPFFTSDMLEVTAFMAAQLLPAHTEYLATHMGRNA